MAKKVLPAIVVILAGIAAYNFVTTGQVTLIPSGNVSPEAERLNALESRIQAAGRRIAQASQAAGVSGLDTTSDVEAAIRDLEKVEEELREVKSKAGSQAIKDRCDGLLSQSRNMRGA